MADKMGIRYDQTTQSGRLRHFFDIADPRCLAPGLFFNMEFDEAKSIIDKRKAALTSGESPKPPSEREWLAKKIVSARVHPDTGDIIPAPFRMSGFAVFGTPTIVGMLLPNPAGNLLQVVFWQSLNQTHNALVNYANRNASTPVPTSSLLMGYTGAVGSSVGISVGLSQLIKKSSMSLAMKSTVSRFVAFPAVAAAGVCNLVLMRQTELTEGIEVKDKNGNRLGSSGAAAEQAIKDTAITRVLLPIPLLIIPPVFMGVVDKVTPLFKRWPRTRLPVEATVAFLAFVFGLPTAMSCFPQEGEIPVSQAEAKFASLKTQSGEPVTTLYYNKGL